MAVRELAPREIDLVELFTDAAGIATDVGTDIARFIDEMQDLG
jgi:hypothetical protein